MDTNFDYNAVSDVTKEAPTDVDKETSESLSESGEGTTTDTTAITEELFEVTVHRLYLRSEPKRKCEPVGELGKGDVIVGLGFEGTYLKVETEDGRAGYVDKKFIKAV